jgi:heptaprenyl diphosphate synthase
MKAARSRQLKVLAGDYFSSRFYHLLSQAGQIDMISKLSNAICEANRLKMNLYLAAKRLKLTSEEYFGLSVDIRKSLFLSFTGLFEGLLLKLWPEVLQSVTSAEVLLNEINRIEINQDYVGSWGYWLVLQNGTKEECKLLKHDEPDPAKVRLLLHKYKVPAQLYQMLETELAELQKLASELGSDKLAGELNYIVEPMRRFLEAPKAMEEV